MTPGKRLIQWARDRQGALVWVWRIAALSLLVAIWFRVDDAAWQAYNAGEEATLAYHTAEEAKKAAENAATICDAALHKLLFSR